MITLERAHQLRAIIEKAAGQMTDEDAIKAVELFPAWAAGVAYEVDVRVKYGGKLYKVVQAHTSQEDWKPDATPALFVAVALPGEIPVWVQPTGAHEAYQMGDKVHYPDADGPVWVSEIDANVYEPGVYGWTLLTGEAEQEEEPTEPTETEEPIEPDTPVEPTDEPTEPTDEPTEPEEISVWVQPIGAEDAYNTGDRVKYPDENGTVYVSTIDNNVWSPEAYPQGWESE